MKNILLTAYLLYVLLVEGPFVLITLGGILGVNHWISWHIRAEIQQMAEKREEAISMNLAPEQLQEKMERTKAP